MVTNAEFRGKILEWIVETYPKYSKIGLEGIQNKHVIEEGNNLGSFQINYIPDGYQLVYQSNLPLMKKFRYKNSENTSITIQVSPGNGSNNYNTENSEIKSCMIGEKNVLYWEKDGVRMCVIKEGEWLISVVTELPFNEVFKIVENINYCNWHVPKVSFGRYIDEKDKGGRVYEKTQQIKTLMLTANIAKLFIPIEICFADMILVFYEGY